MCDEYRDCSNVSDMNAHKEQYVEIMENIIEMLYVKGKFESNQFEDTLSELAMYFELRIPKTEIHIGEKDESNCYASK